MNRYCVLTALLLAIQLTGTSRLFAVSLANHPQAFNDGNGPAAGAWTGIGTYFQVPDHHLEGTVEWAVFAPEHFPPFTGLNGWTPIPGQLIYAYQIINTGDGEVGYFTPSNEPGQLSNLGEVGLGGAQEDSPLQIIEAYGMYTYFDLNTEEGQWLAGVSTGLVSNSQYLPMMVTNSFFVSVYGGFTLNMSNPSIATPSGTIYVPPFPGDYNNDEVVNAADYAVWRDNVGAPAGTLDNDIDGGTIGSAQYNTWRAYFGESAGSGTGAEVKAVPEPNAWCLLLLSLVLFFLPWHCRRADSNRLNSVIISGGRPNGPVL